MENAPAQALRIAALELHEFRCFEHLELKVPADARHVALVGENGSGKTSILEAVSLFAPGTGLRRARRVCLPRVGGSGRARVRIALGGRGRTFATEAGTAKRGLLCDGEPASGGSVAAALPLLWLTPTQIEMFSGTREARQMFWDRITACFFTDHAIVLGRAERLRRERLRLLSDDLRGDDPRGAQARGDWLASIEAGLAAETIAVWERRFATRRRLRAELARGGEKAGDLFRACAISFGGEFAKPFAPLDDDANPEGARTEDASATARGEVQAQLAGRLVRSRGLDAASKRSSVSARRFDFSAALTAGGSAKDAATASTGEQKRAILSLLLAAARGLVAAGSAPVLLLDEASAHLDATRLEALFEALTDLNLQVWTTGQDATRFPRSLFWRYDPGAAKEI